MVLAEVEPDCSYKILDRFKDLTRLGDGAFRGRRLTEPAIARGLEVIGPSRLWRGTRATTESGTSPRTRCVKLSEEVARQTGLMVRVVSGQGEARLIYLDVRYGMDLTTRLSLVVDVGGGSGELIIGNHQWMIQGQSLKLGAIRLKDLYLTGDPRTNPMRQEMQKAIDTQRKTALHQFKTREFDRMVGTSGMVGNLAEIIHLRRTGDPSHSSTSRRSRSRRSRLWNNNCSRQLQESARDSPA